jgi:hypothetical protein
MVDGMQTQKKVQFMQYLENELALPKDSIALALRQVGHTFDLLPMALWQYGLITLPQLEQIFDWLE